MTEVNKVYERNVKHITITQDRFGLVEITVTGLT